MSMKDRDNQIKSHTQHKIVPIVLPTECYNNTIYDDDCVSHWNNYYYYAASGGLPWQIWFEKECLWLGLDTIVKVLFLDWRSTIRKGISTKGIHGCFTNSKLNSCLCSNQNLSAPKGYFAYLTEHSRLKRVSWFLKYVFNQKICRY